jgi:hypothetical protein
MHDVMTVYFEAWIYFCLYMVIVSYLLFNLLIAIVLEEFSNQMRHEQLYVNPANIMQFVEEWQRFDPNCTHFIAATEVPVLLRALEPPLGVGSGSLHVMAFQEALYIPSQDGKVHFVEVFTALLKNAYGTEDMNKIDPRCLSSVALAVGDYFESFKGLNDSGDFLSTYAACKLQAVLGGHKVRQDKADGTGKFSNDPGSPVSSVQEAQPVIDNSPSKGVGSDEHHIIEPVTDPHTQVEHLPQPASAPSEQLPDKEDTAPDAEDIGS